MPQKNDLTEKDLKVLKFISKYHMIKVEDTSLIYKTKRYYRTRINKLIDTKYVKKYKNYIVIDKNGRRALNVVGTSYLKNIQNESYMGRLRNVASIATISIDSNVKFIPSWDIKEKEKYTEVARKYIGKMFRDNKEYLVYYISSIKEHVYIKQLLFDIKKAANENIIIFLENYDVISKNYFNMIFGKDSTLAILNTELNKKIIKEYEKVNIHELIEKVYEQEIMISNWEYADFMLEDETYIVNMIFLDTEKIGRINWFLEENTESNKKIEFITIKNNEEKLRELLDNKCNIRIINENLVGGIDEEEYC